MSNKTKKGKESGDTIIEVFAMPCLLLASLAVFLIWQGAAIAAIAGSVALVLALKTSLTYNANNKV